MKWLILLLFIFENAKAQNIPIDKELHFLACTTITSTTYAIVYDKTKNKNKALIWGLATGLAIGTLKEVYDSTQPHNKFDFKDLGADLIGSLSAGVIIKIF